MKSFPVLRVPTVSECYEYLILFASWSTYVVLCLCVYAVLECGKWWQSSTATPSRAFLQSLRLKNMVSPSLPLIYCNSNKTIKFIWFSGVDIQYVLHFSSAAQFWSETDPNKPLLLCGQSGVNCRHQSYVCEGFFFKGTKRWSDVIGRQ